MKQQQQQRLQHIILRNKCYFLLIIFSYFIVYIPAYLRYPQNLWIFQSSFRLSSTIRPFTKSSSFHLNQIHDNSQRSFPVTLKENDGQVQYELEQDEDQEVENEESPEFASSTSSTKQLILHFNCQEIHPEEISELFFELGASSVSVEVESERKDMIQQEKHWNELMKPANWQTAILRANLPHSFNHHQLLEILQTIYQRELFSEVKIIDLEDRDWVLSVQQLWKPFPITKQLTILFPWHVTQQESILTKHSLLLVGGAAFGTGDHATTRLCCRWLERNLAEANAVQKKGHQSVLDYGCGSGILGLAALKFGASSAVGTDIDRDSLASAQHNAKMNNLHLKLFLVDEVASNRQSNINSTDLLDSQQSLILNSSKGQGIIDGDGFPSVQVIANQQYEIVVANILAPILINLAPTLANHTKYGNGKLALSGVLAKQAERVMDSYRPYFEEVALEEEEDEWVLITCKQRKL